MKAQAVVLTEDAKARVHAARAVVDRTAEGDAPVYGINTGFGSFADVRIATGALDALQINLLRSHAAGVGDLLPVPAVRAMMALRANVLARGHSGIRLETLDLLIAMLNAARAPGGTQPRIGGRQRRPRAAGPPRARPHRRRRGAHRGRAGLRRRGARTGRAGPGSAGAKGRAGAHQRHAGVDGRARPGAGRRRTARPRRRHRRGVVHRRAAWVNPTVSGQNPRRPAACRAGRVRRKHLAPARRQRHQRSRTPTAGGCRTPTRSGAPHRCTAPAATPWRSSRRPSRSRPTPPPTTRWCLPTPATSSRAATFTARRSGLARICSPLRSRTSRRSASAGPSGS